MATAPRTAAAAALPDDLESAILELKEERNAVLLAHYYQESEIQDLADFVGDSLALARAATRVDRRVIAFCGVHFMAETAKILNPERTVVVPDLAAGCSLILKASEETPGSCVEMVKCFADAGLPAGVLNLVFGVPAEVSEHLLAKDAVRKIS